MTVCIIALIIYIVNNVFFPYDKEHMSLAENRKAHFNYEILEKYEAGLVLTGSEVKSLRKGQASLDGSFVSLRDGKPAIVGMHIALYQPGNPSSTADARRERGLLLKESEITEMGERARTEGLAIIPLSVYQKGKRIKLGIALARGKKKHDKRESLKKRDAEREMSRARNA
jgi:SsrA-binding protein